MENFSIILSSISDCTRKLPSVFSSSLSLALNTSIKVASAIVTSSPRTCSSTSTRHSKLSTLASVIFTSRLKAFWKRPAGPHATQPLRWSPERSTLGSRVISGVVGSSSTLWSVVSCRLKTLRHRTCTRKLWLENSKSLDSSRPIAHTSFRRFFRRSRVSVTGSSRYGSTRGTANSETSSHLVCSRATRSCL